MPNVVGCVDGSHIRVLAANLEHDRSYVNRKNFHSVNICAVCDANSVLLYLNAAWPGSSHDSFIFKNSNVWAAYERNGINGYILGDSGYCSIRWLLTPFANPTGDGQERYNEAHKKTRVRIKICFGYLKRRFHCLHSGLRVDIQNVGALIMAAGVLHNIAIRLRLPQFESEEDDFDDDQPIQEIFEANNTRNNFAARALLVENYFS